MSQNQISKVVYGNRTLVDLTSDTVAANKLFKGVTAHSANGSIITGTAEAVMNDEMLVLPEGLISFVSED